MEINWVQVVVNFLMMGLAYTLIASGLTLAFSVMKIINFAHGELFVLGGVIMYYLAEVAGLNYFLSILVCVVLMFVFGFVLERVFWRPLRGQELPSLLISFGVLLTIQSLVWLIYGDRLRGILSPFRGINYVSGAAISNERVAITCASILFLAFLFLLVRKTRLGLIMRAAADNLEGAALQGVNNDRIMGIAFGIGCALAAAAGALLGSVFSVDPFGGPFAVVNAFIVVILGGLGSIAGCLVGGLTLGAIHAVSATFIGELSHLIGLGIIMVIMIVRPRGLLGHA